MRLGELLLRAGYITKAELDAALAAGKSEGTRLGSTLIRLGMIEEGTLARALGKQRRAIPITGLDLAQVDPELITKVPMELAYRHRALPVRLDQNALVVAFVDPRSLDAIDEVQFAAAVKVQPGVAAEDIIERHLQLLYPMPQARHVQMVDSEATAPPPTESWAYQWLRDTGATLEVHPDGCVLVVSAAQWKQLTNRRRVVHELVSDYVGRMHDTTKQITVRARASRELISHFARRGFARQGSATHTPPGRQQTAADDQFLPVLAQATGTVAPPPPVVAAPPPEEAKPVERRSSVMTPLPPIEPLPPPPALAPPRIVTGAALPKPPPAPRAPSRAPLAGDVSVEPVILLTERKKPAVEAPTLEEVLRRIVAAKDTEEVGDHIVEFLSTKLPAVLLLLVKADSALGWKGRATHADQDAIESVMVPLSQASILSEVFESQEIVHRAPDPDDAIVGRLWKLLHCERPAEIAIAPIPLNDRVVNLLYVHPFGEAPLPKDIGAILGDLTRVASDRYLELLVAKKSR